MENGIGYYEALTFGIAYGVVILWAIVLLISEIRSNK